MGGYSGFFDDSFPKLMKVRYHGEREEITWHPVNGTFLDILGVSSAESMKGSAVRLLIAILFIFLCMSLLDNRLSCIDGTLYRVTRDSLGVYDYQTNLYQETEWGPKSTVRSVLSQLANGYSQVTWNSSIYLYGRATARNESSSVFLRCEIVEWPYTCDLIPSPRFSYASTVYHSAIVYGDAMFVLGGEVEFATGQCLFFDFTQREWFECADQLVYGVSSAAVLEYAGMLYLFGGSNSSSSHPSWLECQMLYRNYWLPGCSWPVTSLYPEQVSMVDKSLILIQVANSQLIYSQLSVSDFVWQMNDFQCDITWVGFPIFLNLSTLVGLQYGAENKTLALTLCKTPRDFCDCQIRFLDVAKGFNISSPSQCHTLLYRDHSDQDRAYLYVFSSTSSVRVDIVSLEITPVQSIPFSTRLRYKPVQCGSFVVDLAQLPTLPVYSNVNDSWQLLSLDNLELSPTVAVMGNRLVFVGGYSMLPTYSPNMDIKVLDLQSMLVVRACLHCGLTHSPPWRSGRL